MQIDITDEPDRPEFGAATGGVWVKFGTFLVFMGWAQWWALLQDGEAWEGKRQPPREETRGGAGGVTSPGA